MKTIHFDEICSTQDEAKRIVSSEGQKCSSVLIAEYQTKGKGTHGRVWESEKGKNILMTIILYPECNIRELEGLTLKIAQNIVEIIKELYDIELSIKEPNDIILNGKKLGGILTETQVMNEQVKNLLIGIGLNVNQEEFSGNLNATSLKKEFKKEFNKQDIIDKIIQKTEQSDQ